MTYPSLSFAPPGLNFSGDDGLSTIRNLDVLNDDDLVATRPNFVYQADAVLEYLHESGASVG